jgi:DNA-binding NarL/FixJ family response regulator
MTWATFRYGEEDHVVISHPAPPRRSPPKISQAEAEVLELLLEGRTNSSIARSRATAPRTIANQVASIFRKLGVRSRAELAAAYVRSEKAHAKDPIRSLTASAPRPRMGQVDEALRRTAFVAERARAARGRQSREEVTLLWRDLLMGRWSIVDRFESNERRFILARRGDARTLHTKLTVRERQVVCFAALGCSNKSIAEELHVSESTVSEHLSAALTKLGVRSRVELPRFFAGDRQRFERKTRQRSTSHLSDFFATLYRKRRPFG